MPVYQVGTIGLSLEESQRERIAQEITTIHAEETGAPEPFIRVVFLPIPAGYGYTAGKLADSVIVSANIRSGRSDATRHAIMHRIHDLMVEVTGVPAGKIVVATIDLPSQWLMEAGIVLPQANPEDEAAWFKKLDEQGHIHDSVAG